MLLNILKKVLAIFGKYLKQAHVKVPICLIIMKKHFVFLLTFLPCLCCQTPPLGGIANHLSLQWLISILMVSWMIFEIWRCWYQLEREASWRWKMKTVKSKNGDKVLLSNKNEWSPCTKISQFITILSGNQQYIHNSLVCKMSFQEMFPMGSNITQMYVLSVHTI